jgi:hypothetical protein
MVNEIRTSFLIEFTKQLALNYIATKNGVKEIPQVMPIRGQISEIQEIEHTQYETLGPRQITGIREIEPYDPNVKRVQSLGLRPSIRPQPQEPSFAKSKELISLYELISDKTIDSIECPGPEKNIVIKQNGKILELSKRLKKEEIDSLIKEFSTRSNSEFEEGILKTKVENLSITAVESKFAGTRFVITRATNS